jgi:hypothetical protein
MAPYLLMALISPPMHMMRDSQYSGIILQQRLPMN